MTAPRNHKIDTITIHCYVGQITCERAGEGFADPKRQASCNYVVDKDGRIGLIVEEKNRSWCSGGTLKAGGMTGSENDHRAITIEVASDSFHPYAVTPAAYGALIKLCADICKRNGIKELKWKADKNLVGQIDKQNMTVHRWFANKACCGDWLYSRHGEIAEKVNELLKGSDKMAAIVKDYYVQLLGRQARADEVAYWKAKDELAIWKGIYNSQECQTLYIRR